MRIVRIVALLVAATLLASCSWLTSLEKQDAAEVSRFNAYAGKPVDHFYWLTEHRGWAAISRNQLVAWADFNRPYLITVVQPCPDLMLNYHIGITSTIDEVRTRSNLVIVRGILCGIQTIQPVDYRRMQHELQQHLAGASRKKPAAANLRG